MCKLTEVARVLLPRLYHQDPAVAAQALREATQLSPQDADWNVISAVAHQLERPPEPDAVPTQPEQTAAEMHRAHRQPDGSLREQAWATLTALADRGADLLPAIAVCISALRRNPEASRGWAVRWLHEARCRADWAPVQLGTEAGFLADLLARRPGTPEAGEALEWLTREARNYPKAVADLLLVYRPVEPGSEYAELVRRIEVLDPQSAARIRRKRPEQVPLDLEAALARVRNDAGPLLVAEGQFSPVAGQAVRVGVLAAGQVLADLWVTPETWRALPEALARRGPVRRGEWDVLYATPHHLAWTTDGAPFQLWDRQGLLVSQDGQLLVVRGQPPCPIGTIASLEAYLGADWVSRGVRVRLHSGQRFPIAEARELSAAIDPTYDGLDLLVDASWVTSLAGAMNQALGLPVKPDRSLRVSGGT